MKDLINILGGLLFLLVLVCGTARLGTLTQEQIEAEMLEHCKQGSGTK